MGEFTGRRGAAPCTHSPAHMHGPLLVPSPWMPLFFILGPETQGGPGHSRKQRPPGWGCPVLCSCPRPQGPGRGYCAGRQVLPWAQTGAPIPWLVFCWNHQRGGKREVRRDTWDPWDARPPPQRYSHPKHQHHRAVARALVSRTLLCHDT